jgi:hypothetical protein
VNNFLATTSIFYFFQISLKHSLRGVIYICLVAATFYAQTTITSGSNNETIIIEEAKDREVFSFGKNVVVKQGAKGVFAFGGDVIIEGTVEGDVATIGGSIIQKENAFIGGDVIIFGGTYRPESKNPLRNVGKETVMYAGYEEELRNLTQNPSQLFSPTFSWAFLAQRLLSVLFWFIVTLTFATLAPGAVSRAIVRFQLSNLKVIGIGFLIFVVTTFGVIASLSFLPNYVSAIVSLMAFILLMLAYVFGRVTLQVSIGKFLQKRFLPESRQSETLAILIGVFVWTIFLSIPYFWTFALLILMSSSIGLIITARTTDNWQKL